MSDKGKAQVAESEDQAIEAELGPEPVAGEVGATGAPNGPDENRPPEVSEVAPLPAVEADGPEALERDEPPADDAESESEAPPASAEQPKKRGRRRVQLGELEVGAQTRGKVMATAKFGVFVDIGAVTDGLVHVSEFPKQRVSRVEEMVKSGDTIDVWIKEVDVDGNRISLSMRNKPTHPMRDLAKGEVLAGTVTSVTKYGAFVEIGAETEGLVHISEMSSGFVEKPAEVVSVGEPVEVRIKDIEPGRERISLSMVGLANDMGFGSQDAGAADDEAPNADAEHTPTVVELALRKALGEMNEPDDDEPVEAAAELEEGGGAGSGEREVASRGERESLGEVYERMLAEYRKSKDEG